MKMDFKLPLDQLIEKTNQLIEKTKDLIQFYHDFCDYQQLPLKLKREQKEWPSKYRRNRQKFKEFTVEWNNFIGFDDSPSSRYTILDEETKEILEHRLEKLKSYVGILKAKKKLISKRENASGSLDDDPVKSSQTCLQESETVCLKATDNQDTSQPASQTNWDNEKESGLGNHSNRLSD